MTPEEKEWNKVATRFSAISSPIWSILGILFLIFGAILMLFLGAHN